ncbi:MAG: hypothetical protein M1122_01175 [Candidatus Marsarchaeota archaeon]|jgi:hypothetical protein|nr:hypothetical protein [Candidatus Marsarchaeota archaeon]
MEYEVIVNKKFRYVKVYTILKKIGGNVNPLAKSVQKFMDRYIARKKEKY